MFVEAFRKKTCEMAIKCIRLFQVLPKTDEARIIGKQLLRSATSTASNYRAACRARSQAEFYAKISIVIEECDETLFWLDLLQEASISKRPEINEVQIEVTEILKVVSKARKTISTH